MRSYLLILISISVALTAPSPQYQYSNGYYWPQPQQQQPQKPQVIQLKPAPQSLEASLVSGAPKILDTIFNGVKITLEQAAKLSALATTTAKPSEKFQHDFGENEEESVLTRKVYKSVY
ncbi:unnamed protein product [Caenorhabditis angaria]|uniref:DUF148 domain-containing protein n=1 Tax=Caenorhabditis angaria TaxID=860376 RepID=A0A9P1N3L3_9PELO|nr:unnamed protein product [Caenorhabditis angaria]